MHLPRRAKRVSPTKPLHHLHTPRQKQAHTLFCLLAAPNPLTATPSPLFAQSFLSATATIGLTQNDLQIPPLTRNPSLGKPDGIPGHGLEEIVLRLRSLHRLHRQRDLLVQLLDL